MHILLKNVQVVAPSSPFHGQQQDILIENGIIRQIGTGLSAPQARVVSGDNLHVSLGWTDLFAHFSDPGQEYKEDLQSGVDAAAKGGYTTVMIVPNTQPALHTKAQIEYVISRTRHSAVQVLPIGAVTKNLEGTSLAEMYEMRLAGAVAFSDGLKPIQSPGIMLKALQYVKAVNGTIIQLPDDLSISSHGLMHEGIYSTQLGMPGKPAIAEELIIQRDLELAQYTDSRIHFTGISTRKSAELIANAKGKGIKVTCSVTPYHVSLTDAHLLSYDSNLKLNPPLRTAEDVQALRDAVKTGVIDCFATHHLPQDWDAKQVEFEYAKNGMIGLESAFGVLRKYLPEVPVERLIEMLSAQPRKIFGLPELSLSEGATANLTIFNPEEEWVLSTAHLASKSKNSAYIGAELKGSVKGIINGQYAQV
ncbi:dihydroorotase [Chitinophaga pinensis]|uniref:Dihydroorotase, multifunctional complex type n=1 Tax=Chitinophaga pinensis (strain ATCC 43595 / DSM 2588 / LMG 13176 / NBRC 15968 / NCIMB 11800 / UQM 2034) TaxID=485918 RepID=A0A979G4D8_CHIPD|nr:dihydroorotase [Chitinophaga pinensis]ACU60587.1 dihydroorotase, multifunctional complex type [Chitinophaga pinensis DSM 2588]